MNRKPRKQTLPTASEAQIQKAIIEYLTYKGVCHAVTDRSRIWDKQGRVRQSRISMPGYPDISCVVQSKAVFIEVKSAKGRLSDEQKQCHETLRKHGAIVFVVRSVDEVVMCLAGL